MKTMKALFYGFLMVGTIILTSCGDDDDGPPSFDVSFEPTTAEVAENAGATSVNLILPGGVQGADVSVDFTVTGTAVEGVDYEPIGQTSVTISSGQTSSSVSITPIDNLIEDGSRTVILTISGVTLNGVDIVQGTQGQSFTLTITDDECSPYIAATWNYSATYVSVIPGSGEEIPAGQNGQGLFSEFLEDGVTDNPDHEDGTPSIENPAFSGTVDISDPNSTRAYEISDAMIGQFVGIDATASGKLIDECGTITSPTGADQILFFDFAPVNFTGTIVSENEITIEWEILALGDNETVTNKGSATLTR